MGKIIKSVFDNEQELLKAIIKLNGLGSLEPIQLDPMYFKGNFYKEIPRPNDIYDINPQVSECRRGDARDLCLPNDWFYSMILDPPFMFGNHGKQKEYYSSRTHGILEGFKDLEELYKQILKEAYRVLKNNGILIFKCQDYTDSKTTMTHCLVYQWALKQGFYAKDLAILNLPKNKIANSKLNQKHLRKVHSYFWVFQKKSFKNIGKVNKNESKRLGRIS